MSDERHSPRPEAMRLRLRSDALEWREIEGEIIAIDLVSGNYLATNHTGTALWPALLEGASSQELEGVLMTRFGVPRATARENVAAFLEPLNELNLLYADWDV